MGWTDYTYFRCALRFGFTQAQSLSRSYRLLSSFSRPALLLTTDHPYPWTVVVVSFSKSVTNQLSLQILRHSFKPRVTHFSCIYLWKFAGIILFYLKWSDILNGACGEKTFYAFVIAHDFIGLTAPFHSISMVLQMNLMPKFFSAAVEQGSRT